MVEPINGFELLQVEQLVDVVTEYRYNAEPGWQDHLHDAAANSIADKIIKECAVYRRIEPKKGEAPHIKHRWIVAVARNKEHATTLERQLEVARQKGLDDAASIVRKAAKAYERHDTNIARVIQTALEDVAKQIEARAVMEE